MSPAKFFNHIVFIHHMLNEFSSLFFQITKFMPQSQFMDFPIRFGQLVDFPIRFWSINGLSYSFLVN